MRSLEEGELRSEAGPGDPASRERVARLRRAVGLLPGRERRALHAFYLQEKDAEQARAALGLSRSGLYKLLASARKRLGRTLREDEVSR